MFYPTRGEVDQAQQGNVFKARIPTFSLPTYRQNSHVQLPSYLHRELLEDFMIKMFSLYLHRKPSHNQKAVC